ncbi:MAG: PAS domain S-box protein [Dehalococcoidia bacterium]
MTDPVPNRSAAGGLVSPNERVAAYLVALLGAVLATLVRWALTPLLGDTLPFITYFPAVVVAGWYGGYGPALATVALSALLSAVLFLEPRSVLAVTGPAGIIALIVYVAVGLSIAALAGSQRAARRRVERERTAAERARAALAESERRYRDLFENANDIVYALDMDGRVLDINRYGLAITGYRHDDVAGRLLTDLVPAAYHDRMRSMLARKLEGEEHTVYDLALRAADGRILQIEVTSRLAEEGGRPAGVHGIARDVTARRAAEIALRESEARFRSIAETANEGIWLIDAEARTTFANQRMADLLATTVEDLERRSVPEFCFPEDEPAARERIGHNLGGQPETFDFRFRRTDGSAVEVLAATSPVTNAAGEVVGALGMFSDITVRKQAEMERDRLFAAERAAREAVQQALATRTAFVSAISHDLKSPLAAIKGQAQLLRRRVQRLGIPELAPVNDGLERIDRTVSRITALLGELADAVRLEAGQALDLQRQPVDLVALVDEHIDEWRRSRDETAIRLEAEVDSLVGEWDPVRLGRVITNLLSNAVKYSPDGGEVVVRLWREQAVPGEAACAALAVRDQGMGIPAADLPHIFERFHRGANVGRIEGSGIGLAGVKQIVEQHDGLITAESCEGAGTTITVRLPLVDERAE